MPQFTVMSGEFQLTIIENSALEAAISAIRFHDRTNNRCKLGELTLIIGLADPIYFSTQQLIESNTDGFGEETGQYSYREDSDEDQCIDKIDQFEMD